MNNTSVLAVFTTLTTNAQPLSLHDLADTKTNEKDTLIGLAGPMPGLVENQTDQMLMI